MTQQLGRLENVPLRQIWPSESGSFTPWLASEANISLLSEAIGIDLEVEALEQAVGPFRADILCKDTLLNTWVLIENQIERTDHLHLGQLMTYAAGLDAVTIVWIASQFRDEHRAALDWLNQITHEHFRFFGLEVELWRIGDSAIAPKFNVVCKPNDWTQSISTAASQIDNIGVSDLQQLNLEYWSQLKDLMQSRSGSVRPTKAHAQGFYDCSLGKSGVYLEAFVNHRDSRIGVMIVFGGAQAKPRYRAIEHNRQHFDGQFGEHLEWCLNPDKVQSHIKIVLTGQKTQNRTAWPAQHEWLYEKMESFHRVFSAAVKDVDQLL